MDSSALTQIRKARVLYFEYNARNCGINNGNRVPRPLAKDTNGFAEFGLNVEKGAFIVTPDEIQLSCGGPVPASSGPYTFIRHTAYNSQPNYYYRIYNVETGAWSELIDSGLPTDTHGVYSTGDSYSDMFVAMYEYNNTIVVQVIDPKTIAIKTTFSFSTEYNNDYSVSKDGIIYTSYNGSSYDVGYYKYTTDTLTTGIVDLDDSYYQDNFYVLEKYGAVLFSNGNGSERLYTITDSVTFVLEGNNLYTSTVFDKSLMGSVWNGDYYNTIFFITREGEVKTYEFTGDRDSVYTGVSHFQYGKTFDRIGYEMYNNNTDLYDFYIFNTANGLFESPVTRFGISNYNYYYREEWCDSTTASNVFALMQYNGDMNHIGDGGNDMFDGGNYIGLTISDNSDFAFVSQSDIMYGSVNSGGYNEESFNYAVAPGVVTPHISMASVSNGKILWRAYGATGSGGDAAVSNYNGTYTCQNGLHGKYWMSVNYGTSDPSIGDLWFTVESSVWNSTTALASDNRKTSDNGSYDHSVKVSGSNYLFCKALLSAQNGANIVQADTEAFLANYVQNMNVAYQFADISIYDTMDWHNNNASTYTSYITNWFAYAYDGANPNWGQYGTGRYVSTLFDGSTSFKVLSMYNSIYSYGSVWINPGGAYVLTKEEGEGYTINRMMYITETDIFNSEFEYNSNGSFNYADGWASPNNMLLFMSGSQSGIYIFTIDGQTLVAEQYDSNTYCNIASSSDIFLIDIASEPTSRLFINGEFSVIPKFTNRDSYDGLSNTVYGWRNDGTESNLIVASMAGGSSSVQYATIPQLEYDFTRVLCSKYIMFFTRSPFGLYVVKNDGTHYEYLTEDSVNWPDTYVVPDRTFVQYYDPNYNILFEPTTNTFVDLIDADISGTNNTWTNYDC